MTRYTGTLSLSGWKDRPNLPMEQAGRSPNSSVLAGLELDHLDSTEREELERFGAALCRAASAWDIESHKQKYADRQVLKRWKEKRNAR